MNRKQLTPLIVLALVLGAVGWWVAQRDPYAVSGNRLGQKLIPDFPLNEVTEIVVEEGTNALHLVKTEDRWEVRERYGYPADFAEVGGLLQKMWDMKALQREPASESDFAKLQLAEVDGSTNGATRVTFKLADGKEAAAVLLGKEHMRAGESAGPMGPGGGYPDGRWLRVLDGAKEVALVSETLSQVKVQPDPWLDDEFFKVEKIKRIEVTHPEATNSWKLYRETEGGALVLDEAQESETLDSGKTSSVGNAFSYPRFVDVIDPSTADEALGFDKPIQAEIDTFDGFHYTIRVGEKEENDNYPLRVTVSADLVKERAPGEEESEEDKQRLDEEFQKNLKQQEEKLAAHQAYGSWTYRVSKWTVDPILKQRAELLAEPQEPEEPEATVGGGNVSVPEQESVLEAINPLEPLPPDPDNP